MEFLSEAVAAPLPVTDRPLSAVLHREFVGVLDVGVGDADGQADVETIEHTGDVGLAMRANVMLSLRLSEGVERRN